MATDYCLMKYAKRFLATSLTLSAITGAQAGCLSTDPLVMAKSFFAGHANFAFDDPAKIRELLSPRLFAALAREHKCAKGDLCAMEADPWTDAQDGEILQPATFKTATNTGTQAEVKVSYYFALSASQKRLQSAVLKYRHSAISGCWELDDLLSPNGQSLVGHLEKWHKKFGNK